MRRLASAVFLMIIPSVAAHASCGSASCPLNNHRYLGAGVFLLSLSREYINQDLIYVGSSRSFVGAIPYEHNEVQTINERNILQLQIGLTDRLAFNADIPFVSRQHTHIQRDPAGDRWESWSFSGLGDIVVSGQYSLALPHSSDGAELTLMAGLKVPSGVTNIRNAEGEEAEVTIQPGTGSTDGIAGIFFRQTIASVPTLSGEFSALPLSAGITYQFDGAGTNGYRVGNTLLAHAGTSYQFSARANFLFQINARFQGYAGVGSTNEPRANTGGTWIFASPGMSVELNDTFSVYGYVQLPVYENVHGIQQTSKFNLMFGISANVGLLG